MFQTSTAHPKQNAQRKRMEQEFDIIHANHVSSLFASNGTGSEFTNLAYF
jgi:hypothetical protein